MVKLRDWAGERAALEADPNPFAAIVLAHLAAQDTRQDVVARSLAKFALTRRLYNLGYDKNQILTLFNFIDWMLQLPDALAIQFRDALQQFEEERTMSYITSIERLGREEGREEGLREGRKEGREEALREGLLKALTFGLEFKFGEAALQLMPELEALTTAEQIEAVLDRLRTATNLDEVRAVYRTGTAE